MKKIFIRIFTICLFITSFISIVFYICNHKSVANYILNILTSIGTCSAVLYALFQSLPREEKISANCLLIPVDNCYPIDSNIKRDDIPRIFELNLTNIGNSVVLLPEVLHIDIYANKHHWGFLDINVDNSRILIPNMPRKFTYSIPNETNWRCIADMKNLEIYTWTQSGTVINVVRTNRFYTKPVPIILE